MVAAGHKFTIFGYSTVAIVMVVASVVVHGVPTFAATNCATPLVSSSTASTVTARAYQAWKKAYVVDAGNNTLRVQRSAGDSYDTVSEGIAYGMLFAAYSNDKPTFDGLWRYERSHLNGNGVMNWRIAANGATTGYNGATDADEDMAAALIAADTAWGGYKADALTQIGLVKKYEVEQGSNVMKPGDVWGGSDLLNPSYLTPSYYTVFAQYTGDSSWNAVRAASYNVLNAIKNNTDSKKTGYIPDWSRADGYPAGGMGYDYGYDGSRAPLRLALASSWDCDATAGSLLKTLNATTKGLPLTQLASSYNLSGDATGTGDGTPLLAAATAAATVSDSTAQRTDTWNALVATTPKDYFSDSMRVLGLFIACGQLTSPLSLSAATPAPAPVTTAPKAYILTASDSTAVIGLSTTISVSAAAPSVTSSALVDLEVYDASGNRVAQKFYENQTILPASAPYTVTFTPSKSGTYTVKGGIFTAGWANNLVWNGAISAVTAATPAPIVTPPVIIPPVVTPTPAPAPTPTPAPIITPPPVVVPPIAAAPLLSIWWPGTSQTVRGVQPFKAVLDGTSLSSYAMYWQVDGGTLNLMSDDTTDAPHKESLVNVSPWNWRANRQYAITFVAKNVAGEVLAQKTVIITN